MVGVLDSVRSLLARYQSGELTLDDLKQEFIPLAWSVEESHDQVAIELASEVELRLAEFTSGHWTEDQLRSMIRPLAVTELDFGSVGPSPDDTGSSNSIVLSPLTVEPEGGGIVMRTLSLV